MREEADADAQPVCLAADLLPKVSSGEWKRILFCAYRGTYVQGELFMRDRVYRELLTL